MKNLDLCSEISLRGSGYIWAMLGHPSNHEGVTNLKNPVRIIYKGQKSYWRQWEKQEHLPWCAMEMRHKIKEILQTYILHKIKKKRESEKYVHWKLLRMHTEQSVSFSHVHSTHLTPFIFSLKETLISELQYDWMIIQNPEIKTFELYVGTLSPLP